MGKNITVLVVDDSATIRYYAKSALRSMEIRHVIEAGDGDEAVRILEATQIDIIIADWNMPGLNGLELLKWVRSNKETSHIPFLMLTAESHKENIIEAMKADVSDYIVKPFSLATLSEKLQRFLKN